MVDYDLFMGNTIRILNLAGVDLMDIPERDRCRTLDLEQEITVAANNGDTERFMTSLDEWRSILMIEEEKEYYHKAAA